MNSFLEIDLNKIAANYRIVCSKLQNTISAAAIKANAYGLGYAPVSNALVKAGCKIFLTATTDEALALRAHNQNIEIQVLHGMHSKEQALELINNNITPILNSTQQIKIYQEIAIQQSKLLPAILNFETGLGRLGITETENLDYEGLNLKYIMSHLACAEELNSELNHIQLQRMHEISKLFPGIPVSFANSNSIFSSRDYHFQLVRPGYALYGGNPTILSPNPMHPVVSLQGYIVQKKILQQAQTIGYGALYQAQKGDKIFTIEYGYADGYLRALFQKGYAMAYNKKLPVIGKISMDLMSLDANELTETEFNEIKYVELLGDNITVDEVGKLAGTIGYEVLTSLGARCKRIYKG